MKCKNCGNEFEEGIFCPECGTKVEVELSGEDKEDLKKDENEGEELLEEHKAEQEKVIQEREKQDQLAQEKTVQEQSVEKIEQDNEQKKKKTNRKAIISLILGILSWVGFASIIMPVVGGIWSIIDGIKALKGKTKYKKSAIIGCVLSVLAWVLLIWIIVQPTPETNSKTETTQQDKMEISQEIEEETESVQDNEIIIEEKTNEETEPIQNNETVIEEETNEKNQISSIDETESTDVVDVDAEQDEVETDNLRYDVDFYSLSDEEKREWISTWLGTIDEFDYYFSSDAKKLMKVFDEALKAEISDLTELKEESKGIINPQTYYVQTLNGSTYHYYGEMKDGKPNGKGIILCHDWNEMYPYIIGNFKNGFIDGYAIELDGNIIVSEAFYDEGVLDGKYVLYEELDFAFLGLGNNEEKASDWNVNRLVNEADEILVLNVNTLLHHELISSEGKYKDGKKTGIWKEYLWDFDTLEPWLYSEIKYKKDKTKEGTYYYQNGKIKYKGGLLDGAYNGKGTLYNEDGSVQYKGNFKKGDIAE